jgi:xylan 1,4-beta-xylosidase
MKRWFRVISLKKEMSVERKLTFKIIFILFSSMVYLHQMIYASEYTITIDGSDNIAYIPHFWSECVGTGTMIYCLKPEWRTAMKIGAEEAGFKRVRGHGILIGWNGTENDNIMSISGGTVTYNWANIDSIFDFLLSINVRPSVELSFMPRALQSNGVTSKPNDFNAWRDLIREMVLHCIDRWGEEEVTSWYWEVWNEYDYSGFWNGSKQDYYQLYAKAAEGAKAANPDIKIGGPVTTGSPPLQDFIDYCTTSNVPLDLIANHCYGSAPGSSTDPVSVRNDNRSRSDVIKSSGKQLYSLNTEYNSTWSGQGGNNDPNVMSMDSHINAPFVVKSQKLIIDDYLSGQYLLPDVLSYWAISDVFDESGANKGSWIAMNNYRPFGAVFGLVNYQGIRKATFNAFKMLHMMGDTLVSLSGGSGESDGVDGFATISADGSEVAVIIYNFYTNLTGSGGENTVNVSVGNLPFSAGKVDVMRYLVDADHGNAYGVWEKQGKPASPSESQWEAMREAQHLATVDSSEIDYSGESYTTSFTLSRYAVTLLVFKKKESNKTGYRKKIGISRSSLVYTGTVLDLKNVSNKAAVLSVYSANGRLLRRYEKVPHSIDMAMEFSSGLHIIELQTPQGKVMDKLTVW